MSIEGGGGRCCYFLFSCFGLLEFVRERVWRLQSF
jgi:hypothetical protein